ncbi:MAG: N-acetylglucosamine-6-phosphate deacetylase [Candidatus Limnocylindria bacterium]
MGTLLTDARLVTPNGVLDPGWIKIEGAVIAALGDGAPPPHGSGHDSVNGRWVLPGFIDLHVHGGGGDSMLSADPEEIRDAAAFHALHGTTGLLASVMTAPLDEMITALAAIRDAMRLPGTARSIVLGSHLEGPFLNVRRAGAHDPASLRMPNPVALDRLLESADGTLRSITIAPELPGALDLIRRAVDAGVVVALGHSDADREAAVAAFDAGASLVTHLFNAMSPMDHRRPGLATTALVRPGVVCELINDGVHLHDDSARLAFAAAGPSRIALVTDAIPATGLEDGEHRLGSARVEVAAGVARLAGTETLVGSTLTMDAAVRRAVHALSLPIGEASSAASATPARVLGLADRRGSLAPGLDADIVVLDEELCVEAVMIGGERTTSGRLFDR